jgi:hypothetical protein
MTRLRSTWDLSPTVFSPVVLRLAFSQYLRTGTSSRVAVGELVEGESKALAGDSPLKARTNRGPLASRGYAGGAWSDVAPRARS